MGDFSLPPGRWGGVGGGVVGLQWADGERKRTTEPVFCSRAILVPAAAARMATIRERMISTNATEALLIFVITCYVKISRITLPATSVKRKSRPA